MLIINRDNRDGKNYLLSKLKNFKPQLHNTFTFAYIPNSYVPLAPRSRLLFGEALVRDLISPLKGKITNFENATKMRKKIASVNN